MVWDDPAGDWGRLAWRIGLSGVPDVRAALQDQLLEPARLAVDSLFLVDTVRDVAGAGLAPSDATSTTLLDAAVDTLGGPLEALGRAVGATAGRGVSVTKVQAAAAHRLGELVSIVRAGRSADAAVPPRTSRTAAAARAHRDRAPPDDQIELARWVGSDRARWATLVGWAVGACLGDLVGASTPGATVGVYDAWAAGPALSRVVGELGLPAEDASRVAVLTRALLSIPLGAFTGDDQEQRLDAWLLVPAVRVATGWNQWQGATFVSRESAEEWLAALAAREAATGATGAFAGAALIQRSLEAQGYQVDRPVQDEPAG